VISVGFNEETGAYSNLPETWVELLNMPLKYANNSAVGKGADVDAII
jgi:hypothetical protein